MANFDPPERPIDIQDAFELVTEVSRDHSYTYSTAGPKTACRECNQDCPCSAKRLAETTASALSELGRARNTIERLSTNIDTPPDPREWTIEGAFKDIVFIGGVGALIGAVIATSACFAASWMGWL